MQNTLRASSFCGYRLTAFVSALAVCVPLAVSAGTLDTPVVGGHTAEPGDYPDVVAVLTKDGSLCTGTLLGADLVLTAAHCIGGVPDRVIIGSVDLAAPGGERRGVKMSAAYPRWQSTFDVGIVMLENPVSVKPMPVVAGCTATRLSRGAHVEVVGFGLTTAKATDHNTRMHAAPVSVVDATCTQDDACNSAIAPGGELVAGGNGTDACYGDSGGPLFIATAKGRAQLGVVSRGLASWGDPCADGGVYVRADAPEVVKWIEATSHRKLERVACDAPSDDPSDTTGSGGDVGDGDAHMDDAGGCSAAGGALEACFALIYGAGCIRSLRLARLRRLRGRLL